MLIVTTRSKSLRKWTWLMFWAFLLTASWGLLLTMHWRTTPKERSEQ
jgi:hypothetical protein